MSKKIVHALDGGRTLCDFMPGAAASDWPNGHVWMALESYGCHPGFSPESARTETSEPCAKCVDAFERIEDG